MRNVLFADRAEAGRRVSEQLQHLRGEDLVVLALPRGGVPVALEVARTLDAPLDVIVVRKLGVPYQPELGMGAIGEDGVRVINDSIFQFAGVTDRELAEVESRERTELERRASRFRGIRPRISLRGKTAVIVDDGIATGSTARAACQVARGHGASRVVIAVPVAPPGWTADFDADEYIAVETPLSLHSIGEWYGDFSQTSDEEVLACLESRRNDHLVSQEVEISVGTAVLPGLLTTVGDPAGMVVFAHGSGSSRLSRRNRYVADMLNDAGFATLLFDLLTAEEEPHRSNVFDIQLLGNRLVTVTTWLASQPSIRGLPIGYFGASTGAAAALWAAADPTTNVDAVVSRGGRPDLAEPRLRSVMTPTRLIVGSRDETVLGLNRQAQALMRCSNDLVIIDGATHLFEEPGTLQQAAEAAQDWFARHFIGAAATRPATQPGQDPVDPFWVQAREDAEGVEVFEGTTAPVAHRQAEEAQGSELFANPDEAVSAQALKEGSPGHESWGGLDDFDESDIEIQYQVGNGTIREPG